MIYYAKNSWSKAKFQEFSRLTKLHKFSRWVGTWTSVVEITAMYAICSNTHTDLKPLYWPQNVQSQELLLLYGTDEFWLQNQQLTVIDIFDLNTQRQQKLLSADDVGQLMYDYHKANIFYSCDAGPACNKHDVRYSTVSIHPSVTSRSSIETARRIELVLAQRFSTDLSYTVF